MDEKISIIVPVYNVEKYLDRCVSSLVEQTYKNLEIILVDDGSPDSCPKMCDDWAEKDSRIKVVHKTNAGLGMARNSGLDVMTGDFVMFVDSDDYINRKTCEIALTEILEESADACFYSCLEGYHGKLPNDASGKYTTRLVFGDNQVVDDFLVETLAPSESNKDKTVDVGISSCMALYRADVIQNNSIRFCSEREFLNEDYLFRIDLCRYAKKIVAINAPLYCYYHHSGTLTTSYNEEHFSESVKMFEAGKKALSPFGSDELQRRNTRFFMTNVLSCFKHEVFFKKNYFRLLKTLRRYCKDKTLQSALRSYPLSALPYAQKAFFYAIRLKSTLLVYILIKLKFRTLKR